MAVMAKISTKKPTNRKGKPPVEASNNMVVEKPQVEPKKDLNFKVPASFKTEFKTYAASKGISMTDLLTMMFKEYKSNHS